MAVSPPTVRPVVIATVAGSPIVIVPLSSATVVSLDTLVNVIVPPRLIAVLLPPCLATVIALLDNELFAIFVNVLSGPLIVLFVSVSVVAFPTSVSVAAGNVTVTSAVLAGPIKVTAFVPLSVSSLNSILPAALDDPVIIGAVKFIHALKEINNLI